MIWTEEEGWGHAKLKSLPWGTQESGARGLRVDSRAGESDGTKALSTTDNKSGTWGRHGAQERRAKTDATGIGRKQIPWELV